MDPSSYNRLQIGSGVKSKKLTMEISMNYINKVMEELKDDKETAMTFLNLLKDFKENRVTVDEVVSSVGLLFKEHCDLLAEFRAFIPKESFCRSRQSFPSQQRPPFDEAITFVTRYGNNKQVYKEFLYILNRCRIEKMPLETAKQEVATLFHGNDDLIEEFQKYANAMV